MSDVEPNLKPFGVCGCGCGLEGVLRTKAWQDETLCVSRGCKCKRCQGLRNKRMGAKSQRRGKKELGIISASSLHTGHEENDSHPWENKRHDALTGPAFTAWEKVENQYERNRPIGRGPLLFFRAEHSKRRYSLVIMRGDRLYNAWYTLGVNRGWIKE